MGFDQEKKASCFQQGKYTDISGMLAKSYQSLKSQTQIPFLVCPLNFFSGLFLCRVSITHCIFLYFSCVLWLIIILNWRVLEGRTRLDSPFICP